MLGVCPVSIVHVMLVRVGAVSMLVSAMCVKSVALHVSVGKHAEALRCALILLSLINVCAICSHWLHAWPAPDQIVSVTLENR